MTAICFVCNLPILSHQVGLVWQGGNGWDDLVREQLEDSTLRQRLGAGRRDSSAQITTVSPPSEVRETSPPTAPRRRRSSLAQLTDILREWGGSTNKGRGSKEAQLVRRETLADLARSLPWSRPEPTPRKRRESSADSGVKSAPNKTSAISDFRSDLAKLWGSRRESTIAVVGTRRGSGSSGGRRDSVVISRRGSGESTRRSSRRQRRMEQPRPSTSSTASDAPVETTTATMSDLPIAPAITLAGPSPTSPLPSPSSQPPSQPPPAPPTPSHPHPLLSTRRDSTTQVYTKGRRDSRSAVSPERRPSGKDGRLPRLQRQGTAIDESWPGQGGRRGSQPTLSPDPPDEGGPRKARRDSLSPDSASCVRLGRRDSRARLSPDRGERDASPRRGRLRRQSTSVAGRGRSARSPESSSTCSSRDASPCKAPPPPIHAPAIRRQSTTEEILIARGFRRQSTTEEMIRCRNFRRQSSQSDDTCCRYRGRRDSCAQITDGTLATMTVETTSTFFDSSTQTVL